MVHGAYNYTYWVSHMAWDVMPGCARYVVNKNGPLVNPKIAGDMDVH